MKILFLGLAILAFTNVSDSRAPDKESSPMLTSNSNGPPKKISVNIPSSSEPKRTSLPRSRKSNYITDLRNLLPLDKYLPSLAALSDEELANKFNGMTETAKKALKGLSTLKSMDGESFMRLFQSSLKQLDVQSLFKGTDASEYLERAQKYFDEDMTPEMREKFAEFAEKAKEYAEKQLMQ